MYNQITISLRGPPISRENKKVWPFFFSDNFFPHYEYWGAAATRIIS